MKAITILLALLLSFPAISQTKNFPSLTGHTLDGPAISLPLAGTKKFSIIGICYKRSAEEDLKTWIQPMYDVFVAKPNATDFFDVANYYDVNYYFIPLISGFKKASADFKASTQQDLWKNVIDCDTDINVLKAQLKPSDESVPYFYVVDTNGKVTQIVSGKYTEDKMDKIQEAID